MLNIFGEGVPWLGTGVQPGFCIYGFGEHWVSQGWEGRGLGWGSDLEQVCLPCAGYCRLSSG